MSFDIHPEVESYHDSDMTYCFITYLGTFPWWLWQFLRCVCLYLKKFNEYCHYYSATQIYKHRHWHDIMTYMFFCCVWMHVRDLHVHQLWFSALSFTIISFPVFIQSPFLLSPNNITLKNIQTTSPIYQGWAQTWGQTWGKGSKERRWRWRCSASTSGMSLMSRGGGARKEWRCQLTLEDLIGGRVPCFGCRGGSDISLKLILKYFFLIVGF